MSEAIVQRFMAASRAADHGAALATIHALPEPLRQQFEWRAHEADLLGKLGRLDEEIAILRALAADRPEVLGLRVSIANALRGLGRSEEAVAELRAALAADPTYGRAWWMLSDMKRLRFTDEDVAAMRRALDQRRDDDNAAFLHFALGKALEDRGEAGAAFDHYAAGNELRRSATVTGPDQTSLRVDRTIAAFTPEMMKARRGLGHPSAAPIFIVGMQRSGSTLIEQILASHPEVEGLSEQHALPRLVDEIATDPALGPGPFTDRLVRLDGAGLAAVGQAYLDRVAPSRRTERPRFVDKLPHNWINTGVIRLILPNARIIDARRHPMATLVSIFRQNFGAGADFSTSLTALGTRYRDYLRLMEHFDRVAPGTVHRVINERLIDEPQPQIRALLDHIGLAFDPACLSFHETERVVRTPSAEQVRQPLSRAGVDRWRMFEPYLGELRDALGDALERWDR